MRLVNPFTGKLVEASDDVADQLLRAGFTEQEPEAVDSEKESAPTPKRRSRKSDS